jgi:hypothetical protein
MDLHITQQLYKLQDINTINNQESSLTCNYAQSFTYNIMNSLTCD